VLLLTSTLLAVRRCSSIVICHVADGDMAPASGVRKGQGEGGSVAHLDIVHHSSVLCVVVVHAWLLATSPTCCVKKVRGG
jgi:hypothetical protein